MQLHIENDAEGANATLKLMRTLVDGLCVVKSCKSFCRYECKEDNIHACSTLFNLAIHTVNEMLRKKFVLTAIDHLAKIFRSALILLGKMGTCTLRSHLQSHAVTEIRDLVKFCETDKSYAIMIAPILAEMVKKMGSLPKFMMHCNRPNLLRMLWGLYQKAQDWVKFMEVGYLILALHQEFPADFIHLLVHIVGVTVRTAKMADKSMKTPHEYLHDNDIFASYKLKRPANYDPIEMACFYFKHTVPNHEVYYENYLSEIIKYAALETDAVKSCRFLHYSMGVADKEANLAADKLAKSLKAHITKTKSPSVMLLLGKLLFLQYTATAKEFVLKHKNIQMSVELSDEGLASPDSVFRQLNFDMEINQIEQLIFIKKTYTDFIDFYLTEAPEEREQYVAEKCNIVVTAKYLANQLIWRGYLEYGLDLCWKVYQFAVAANEELTMIEAASYLAEYSTEFKLLHPKHYLNETLDTCSDLVKEKLKTFDKLGARMQTTILNYLLDLIVFMCEDKRADDKNVKQLLIFVAGMIGGIDADLITKMYGIDIDIKTVPNKAFDGIRFKMYATVFTMITKYNIKYPYNPHLLMEHLLRFFKANSVIMIEPSQGVVLTGVKAISLIVQFCQTHFETTQYEPMLVAMLKIVTRYGFTRSIAEAILSKILLDLSAEKLESCLVGSKKKNPCNFVED